MLEWMVLIAVRAALTASTREVNWAVISTFSSAATVAVATGATVAGAGAATTTGAATGAGVAATVAVGAVAFLADFLAAGAELDICILVIGEVFAVYKRGNAVMNRVSELLNFVRRSGEKVTSDATALVYFSRHSYSFLSNRKIECPNGSLNVRISNPRNWHRNNVRMLLHMETIVESITRNQYLME